MLDLTVYPEVIMMQIKQLMFRVVRTVDYNI